MATMDGHRLVVISPHLDDGVFSCGDLLASHPGSFVMTVFAGRPRNDMALTPWDAASGFQPGDDVIGCRRREDARALALLAARPIWLDFLDAQYAQPATTEEIVEALSAAIDRAHAQTVAMPMGLFHDDHRQTYEACLLARRRDEGLRWLVYEDAIYRKVPGLLDERQRSRGWRVHAPEPFSLPGRPASVAKCRAVDVYQSQLRALMLPGHPGYENAFEPERYWVLSGTGSAVGAALGRPNEVTS